MEPADSATLAPSNGSVPKDPTTSSTDAGLGRTQWWRGTESFDFKSQQDGSDRNEDICTICLSRGNLLCCDGTCKRSFHLSCLKMSEEDLPEGEWWCDDCSNRGRVEERVGAKR